MNPVKKAFNWLMSKNEDERKYIGVPLQSDESLELKALKLQNASFKAQLGRISADKKWEQEQHKKVDEEQEVIADLREQERKITLDKFGNVYSLTLFFKELLKNDKFRDNLELTDRDDQEVLAKFGDLQVSEKQGLVITDVHGNPISYGHSLSDIVYKPETFGMQLKRGRFLMPFDKDWNPVVDIESLEVPDVVYNERDNRFDETREVRGKVRDLLITKHKQIAEKSRYIERLESAQVDMNTQIADLKRSLTIFKSKDQVKESELSQAMTSTMQFNSVIGDMNRKIANLTETKAMYENKIHVLEQALSKLLLRFEQSGDKTLYEQVQEDVKATIDWAKSVVPETIHVTEAPAPKVPRMPNPGENLGRTGT